MKNEDTVQHFLKAFFHAYMQKGSEDEILGYIHEAAGVFGFSQIQAAIENYFESKVNALTNEDIEAINESSLIK